MKRDLLGSIKDFVCRYTRMERESDKMKRIVANKIKWREKRLQFDEKKKLIESKQNRMGY